MGWLDKIARRLGYVPRAKRTATGFAAADVSRLTASLAGETEQINNVLRYQLRRLRARSRQLAQNNPYGKRFAAMVVDNVCGPTPFRLQAKVKFKSGKLDTTSNARIESCFKSWSRKGNCEITGRWSWSAVLRLLIRTLAVDGELLFRVYRGPAYGPHGFQIQVLDIDRLDDQLNKALPNGGAIHMGVELDAQARPVAYHLLKSKPAQWQSGYTPREHERVPAADIVHYFVPEYAEQVRGVPWMYAAMVNLVHIGAFAEAAVIAARVGATQMGFISSPDGDATPLADGQTANGTPQFDAEPGTFPVMPPGYSMESWNPKYPDAAIEPFLNACLRGVAVGFNVAHHNLSGDMNGVNYSSARIAELDERDNWMTIQNGVAEHVIDPLVSGEWLRQQVIVGKLPFPLEKLDLYRECYFQPRRWAWVDPAKEVKAAMEAIDGKLKSRTRVIAEGGEDIEDVFDEIAEETQLAKDKNISLEPAPKPAAATAATGEPDADETADQTNA
jgi:lambda family phage portal protein